MSGGAAARLHTLCLLRIGLLQKCAPVLVLSERLGEHQTVVAGGETVVHKHVHPFTVTPELKRRMRSK